MILANKLTMKSYQQIKLYKSATMHKYQIIDVIDEGAYGIVWKALNKDSNSLVAIKEFKEGDEDQFNRKTIQREIKMLKMLKSDYVVGLKQAFKKKGKIYLIFEYFERNLLNLIERFETGLQPSLISEVVFKIIKCIQFLHNKNIIHRDIKPQNLLLTSDYQKLKLCDFGFARFLPENDYDLTQYVATRWYRSPELLVGEKYGKPADLWAVGCIIGELVDGQPMFPGDDEIDQIYIINKAVGNLTEVQVEHFNNNPKFVDIELPEVKRTDSIEMRYLGRIEKNAFNFMKQCLKMNPQERITAEQALKHPYLLKHSINDNEFTNDQQNLLDSSRKKNIISIMKNQSKASLISVNEGPTLLPKEITPEKSLPFKNKFQTNINTNNNKNTLRLEAGSLPGKESMYRLNPIQESLNKSNKKKSHTNLQMGMKQSEFGDSPSPKMKYNKDSLKKMPKLVSQEKNLKLNVDLSVKINLKINEKLRQGERTQKEKKPSKLTETIKKSLITNSVSKLPDIRGSQPQQTRYKVFKNPKKLSNLISVVGESKELTKGSKNNLVSH